MQNRIDFEQAADKIAESYIAGKGQQSINQLSTEVAKTAGLNPEGIRTIVRMANVSAFQKLFSTKTGSDRNIVFELGQPETIIDSLFASAKCEVKQASDNSYDRRKDYYSDIPSMEKAATYDAPRVALENSPRVSKAYLVHLLKEAGEHLRQEMGQLEYRWLENMEKAAQVLALVSEKKLSNIHLFEKEALCKFGEEIIPELKILHYMVLKERDGFLYDHDKIAEVIEFNVSGSNTKFKNVHTFVKTAEETRKVLLGCQKKRAWVTDQLSSVKEN